MQQVSISFDATYATAENLANLLEKAGFGLASTYLNVPDFRSKFLCPGATGVFAVEQSTHELIGLARVFSDNVFTTYISEVCVHPAFRKKGIASNLVKAITKQFDHTAIFADAFRDHVSVFIKNSIAPKEKLIACSRRPHISDLAAH